MIRRRTRSVASMNKYALEARGEKSRGCAIFRCPIPDGDTEMCSIGCYTPTRAEKIILINLPPYTAVKQQPPGTFHLLLNQTLWITPLCLHQLKPKRQRSRNSSAVGENGQWTISSLAGLTIACKRDFHMVIGRIRVRNWRKCFPRLCQP